MAPLLTFVILVCTLAASVLIHFEALQHLHGRSLRGRRGILIAFMLLLGVHLLEVGLFGTAFYGATKWIQIGSFAGERSMSFMDYYYYAAETYSSLGYGDIYPVGEIRLLASVTPIIGILLLGWSSSFLFTIAHAGRAERT
ncbi:MAG: ion channel [Micropepsaceae bacterium]